MYHAESWKEFGFGDKVWALTMKTDLNQISMINDYEGSDSQ